MADDRAVYAPKINVDTTDETVTLNGTVLNSAEGDKDVGLARSVDGVKSVESNLIVRRLETSTFVESGWARAARMDPS